MEYEKLCNLEMSTQKIQWPLVEFWGQSLEVSECTWLSRCRRLSRRFGSSSQLFRKLDPSSRRRRRLRSSPPCRRRTPRGGRTAPVRRRTGSRVASTAPSKTSTENRFERRRPHVPPTGCPGRWTSDVDCRGWKSWRRRSGRDWGSPSSRLMAPCRRYNADTWEHASRLDFTFQAYNLEV